MTLREAVDICDPDADPLGCAFLIAGFMRSALQGEPSTFEGDLASLVMAHEVGIDTTTGDGIRAWLADLGRVPDVDVPRRFWDEFTRAAEADEANDAAPTPPAGGSPEGV